MYNYDFREIIQEFFKNSIVQILRKSGSTCEKPNIFTSSFSFLTFVDINFWNLLMNKIVIFLSLLWKICCAIGSEIGERQIEMTNAPTADIYRTNDIVIESVQPVVVWAPEIIDGMHGNARQQPVDRRHCFERTAHRSFVGTLHFRHTFLRNNGILHRSDNTP